YAIEDLGYAPKDIVLIGFSLGTAAMVHIASITPDLVFSYDKAENIKCPTLVCHGQDDAIVDHHHGLAMKERIANSELFLIPASHQVQQRPYKL
ncbi:hypothetical protein COOONC_24577, partial [Cooperia oncophora]